MDINLVKDALTGNYVKPNIFLCEVDKSIICKLETTDTKVSLKFNSYSEISFEVSRIYNNLITGETKPFPFYDKIEALRLIKVEGVGYFEIQSAEISSDGIKESKIVTAYSLEYTLSQKYLEDLYNDGTVGSIDSNYIDDVYGGELPSGTEYPLITLYNKDNTKLSLLHIILEKAYGWDIGYVDVSLQTKSRQFNIDRTSIYDFIMNDICEMFNCYAVFDTINNKINLYAEALTQTFKCNGEQKIFTLNVPYQTIGTVSDNGYKLTKEKYKYDSSTGKLTLNDAPANENMLEVISEDLTPWETDVLVSFDNLSQEASVSYNADDIKTVLTVEYGEGQNIREVNLGMPYITDLSYYNTPDWMGQELYNIYKEYNEACDAVKNEYTDNVETRLEHAVSLDYEENRTSLGYSIERHVTSETVGTYYIRTGSSPKYTYAEKTLPADYKAGTTYYKIDGTNLTENNIVNLRKALGHYFKEDSMEELDKLVEEFEFTNTNTIPFGDKTHSNSKSLLYTLNKYKSLGALKKNDGDETRNPEDLYENMDIKSSEAKTRDKAIKDFLHEILDQFGLNMLNVVKDMYLKAQEGFIGGWEAAKVGYNEEDDDELTDEEIEEIEGEIKDSAKDYPNYYPIVLILEVLEEEIGTSIYSTPPASISTGRYVKIDDLTTKINALIEENAKITESLNMDVWFKANHPDNYKQLLMRLNPFLREDELRLENIVSTELDGISESLSIQNDALSDAYLELKKISQPQLSFSMTMANIFALPEFEPIIRQFKLGNLIKVAIRPDYIKQSRLLQIDMGLDDLSDFSCEFGELTNLSAQSDIHADLLSQAASAGKQVATNSSYWTQGADTATATDLKIQQGLLDAATEIKAIDSTQAVSIDRYGIHLRKENPDNASGYDDKQGWIVNNQFLYSDDAFKTVKSVFGEYKVDNKTYWGLLAEAVVAGYIEGSTMVGGQLYSSNYNNNPPTGTYINLETGDFEIGGDRFVYDSTTNDLSLNGVTIDWNTSNPPKTTDIDGLDAYLNQLDGRIQSYSQTNDPSSNWDTEDKKKKHIGDLWFNPTDGLTKRWSGTSWEVVSDSELKELAQSKAKIFTSTPKPPYSKGDLWVQGVSGDIMHCIVGKNKGQSYDASDWTISSKYTNDDALEAFIEGEYADSLNTINTQIDKKAETWYQTTDPSFNWTTDDLKKKHVGDLWFDTSKNKSYMYDSSYKWVEANGVPDEVFDAIDGKSTIYVSKPKSQAQGDLLIPNETFTSKYNSTTYNFVEKKIYRCTTKSSTFRPDYWTEVDYTDNEELLSFINGTYAETIENINNQIDGKADTYYQKDAPHSEYSNVANNKTYNLHVGDLWYDIDDGKTYIYQKETNNNGTYNYKWKFMNVPQDVFDKMDGIASIYVTIPDEPQVGDLLIPESNTGDYKAGKVYKYNGNLWKEIEYTDDTLAKEALAKAEQGVKDAATAYSLADGAKTAASNAEINAKKYADDKDTLLNDAITGAYKKYTDSEISSFDKLVANYLGVGGGTLIGDNYIVSPIIEGGYLNITNTNNKSRVIIDPNNLTGNNFIFQVHNGKEVSVGVDKEGNAVFAGTITARNGLIGGWWISNDKLYNYDDDYGYSIFQSPNANRASSFAIGVTKTDFDKGIYTNAYFRVSRHGNIVLKGKTDGNESSGGILYCYDDSDADPKDEPNEEVKAKIRVLTSNTTTIGTVDYFNRLTYIYPNKIYMRLIAKDSNKKNIVRGGSIYLGYNNSDSVTDDDGKKIAGQPGTYFKFSRPIDIGDEGIKGTDGHVSLIRLSDNTDKAGAKDLHVGVNREYCYSAVRNIYTKGRNLSFCAYGTTKSETDDKEPVYSGEIKMYGRFTRSIFLDNGTYLRGMKSGYTNAIGGGETKEGTASHTNVIAYVTSKDNVVLGHADNTKSTYVRSKNSVYLSCNGIDTDSSRYVFEACKYENDNYKVGNEKRNRGTFRPSIATSSNYLSDLGSPSYKWNNVYMQGSIQDSDRRLKENIININERQIELFDLLQPVSYNFKERSRTHFGYISQDIEDALKQLGMTSKDFAGFCKDIKTTKDENGNEVPVLDENGNVDYIYGLNYTEFIALNTAKIKQLEQNLNQAIETINKQQEIIEELKNKML